MEFFLYFYYICIFFNIVWFALHVFEFYRSCFLSILSFFNLLFFYPISRLMHTNTCDKTALLLFFFNLFIGGRDHIARIYFPDLFIDKCSHMTEFYIMKCEWKWWDISCSKVLTNKCTPWHFSILAFKMKMLTIY